MTVTDRPQTVCTQYLANAPIPRQDSWITAAVEFGAHSEDRHHAADHRLNLLFEMVRSDQLRFSPPLLQAALLTSIERRKPCQEQMVSQLRGCLATREPRRYCWLFVRPDRWQRVQNILQRRGLGRLVPADSVEDDKLVALTAEEPSYYPSQLVRESQ